MFNSFFYSIVLMSLWRETSLFDLSDSTQTNCSWNWTWKWSPHSPVLPSSIKKRTREIESWNHWGLLSCGYSLPSTHINPIADCPPCQATCPTWKLGSAAVMMLMAFYLGLAYIIGFIGHVYATTTVSMGWWWLVRCHRSIVYRVYSTRSHYT